MIFELSVSLPCHHTGVARRVPQPQEEIAVGGTRRSSHSPLTEARDRHTATGDSGSSATGPRDTQQRRTPPCRRTCLLVLIDSSVTY